MNLTTIGLETFGRGATGGIPRTGFTLEFNAGKLFARLPGRRSPKNNQRSEVKNTNFFSPTFTSISRVSDRNVLPLLSSAPQALPENMEWFFSMGSDDGHSPNHKKSPKQVAGKQVMELRTFAPYDCVRVVINRNLMSWEV